MLLQIFPFKELKSRYFFDGTSRRVLVFHFKFMSKAHSVFRNLRNNYMFCFINNENICFTYALRISDKNFFVSFVSIIKQFGLKRHNRLSRNHIGWASIDSVICNINAICFGQFRRTSQHIFFGLKDHLSRGHPCSCRDKDMFFSSLRKRESNRSHSRVGRKELYPKSV